MPTLDGGAAADNEPALGLSARLAARRRTETPISLGHSLIPDFIVLPVPPPPLVRGGVGVDAKRE